MFLDYLALIILLIGLTLVFYTFIYIHDLPHKIAKERHHPHEEAIHVACWLSLFTLHAIWPIVFLWAVSHKKDVGGIHVIGLDASQREIGNRLVELERRLKKLEGVDGKASPHLEKVP
jgi:hypothetical protein